MIDTIWLQVLRVAAAKLAEGYPRSVGKIAAAMVAAPEVSLFFFFFVSR